MDFSKVKEVTIPEGVVLKIMSGAKLLWEKITFKNQVPLSTDTDGSIFNGTGYKDNVRLSSSGGVSGSAQNGSTTTGFIPINGDKDYMRMKGVQFYGLTTANGHHYFNYYDSSKKFLIYISAEMITSGTYDHVISLTRDSNGVETVKWNEDYGTTNSMLQLVRKASFVRITAKGKGADMIVTINEEIT